MPQIPTPNQTPDAADSRSNGQQPIIAVNDLAVTFKTDVGVVRAVNDVNIRLMPGQSVGVVGESGCGKSVTAYSLMRLLSHNASIDAGEIIYRRPDGSVVDLAAVDDDGKLIRSIRGSEISLIFQEPMAALSPIHKVKDQISEVLRIHGLADKKEAEQRSVELLSRVGIPNARDRIRDYPFQFSGGMRQRVMIAMALAANPRVVIADEPTTALDVTIQAQVLSLLQKMQRESNLTLLLITHDLGVIAKMVSYVYVMYLGYVVEEGSTKEIFASPKHPYTRDLLRSIPKLRGESEKLSAIKGSVPDGYHLPSGCPFHDRCSSFVGDQCTQAMPQRVKVSETHKVSCYLYTDSPSEKS